MLGQKDKQSCMHAFLQAVTAVKFPRKYSRQRDVTIITSTHVVINYHYHNHLTRRLEEKWITDLVMILKCPKVSCTRYCIIFYGELYYYLHFERSSNFLYYCENYDGHCTFVYSNGLEVIINFDNNLCVCRT